MLDDSSKISLGSQLDDIRKFIEARPTTTQIGSAERHAQVLQNLTNDHALASKALRLPLDEPGPTPALISRWAI